MENAGRQVAKWLPPFREEPGRKIAHWTGKGNNAGDGFVAARYLSNLGKVRLFLCARAEELIHDVTNYRFVSSWE